MVVLIIWNKYVHVDMVKPDSRPLKQLSGFYKMSPSLL